MDLSKVTSGSHSRAVPALPELQGCQKAGCHPVFVLPWKEGTRDEHQEQHLCSRAHGAPRDFPHPSACACLPQVRRTQALEPAWPPPDGEISHLHPADSCSLAHSSHWRAKLQENPWDGRKEHNAHSGTAVSSSRVKLEPQWEWPCWYPAPFLGAVLPFPQSSLLQLEL